MGNVTRLKDYKAGPETLDFTYDALDRLLTARGTYSETYTYTGNARSAT